MAVWLFWLGERSGSGINGRLVVLGRPGGDFFDFCLLVVVFWRSCLDFFYFCLLFLFFWRFRSDFFDFCLLVVVFWRSRLDFFDFCLLFLFFWRFQNDFFDFCLLFFYFFGGFEVIFLTSLISLAGAFFFLGFWLFFCRGSR